VRLGAAFLLELRALFADTLGKLLVLTMFRALGK
jgi:hypothetical protein